jgi:hypothetical protein
MIGQRWTKLRITCLQIEDLKLRFGDHRVLQNLEMRRREFVNYQNIVLKLKNDKLRPRHWITLQVLTI